MGFNEKNVGRENLMIRVGVPNPKAAGSDGAFIRFLRLIRFSHTIFALPFALASLIVAANGLPSARILILVLIAMVSARTAAMLFNRLADWTIDQRNRRTESRHLLARKAVVQIALIMSCGFFVLSAALINHLTLILAPVALAIIFFYSITKRFTDATHFFLGLALGIAPVAAWIAQTGRVASPPLILAFGVLCWVAGFDIIYATQDVDFDRREDLHSLVVRLGIERSLRLAQFLHVVMFIALLVFGTVAKLGRIYFAVSLPIAIALLYENRIARRGDMAAINRAFFQSNAFVSAIFLLAVCLDQLA